MPKLHKSLAFYTCRLALRLAQCSGSRWGRAPALQLEDCIHSLAVASSLETSSAFAASTGQQALSSSRIESYTTFDQLVGSRTSMCLKASTHDARSRKSVLPPQLNVQHVPGFQLSFTGYASRAVACQLPVEAHLPLYPSFYLQSFCLNSAAKSAPWNKKASVKTIYLNLC